MTAFSTRAGRAAAHRHVHGPGFLQNWLRVTTTRTFIDCCRGQPESPEVPIRSELVDVLAEPKGDPELQLLKREHVKHFKASFAEAVGRAATARIACC